MKFLPNLFRLLPSVSLIFTLTLAISCKNEVSSPTPNQSPLQQDATLRHILSLGFNKNKIVEYPDYYVVEGDILFEKKNYGSPNGRQSINGSPAVGLQKSGNITVRVGDFLDDTWRNEVITATVSAITSWNNINGTNLQLQYVSGPSADITIQLNSNLSGLYGLSSWPSGCNPGTTIGLSRSSRSITAAQKHFVVTHELGHAIGFRHTDEGSSQGVHIVGTPYYDSNSLMNSGNSQPLQNGATFSNNDILATQTLYPTVANVQADYVAQPGGSVVAVKWTISQYCSNNVTIDVYDGNGQKVHTVTAGNIGIFNLSPASYSPGVTYEVEVYDPSNYGTMLYDSFNF